MPNVLIRNLGEQTLERLKERATQNERSLQAELKTILERAAGADVAAGRALAAQIRKRLGGRKHSDSARLLAADRRR